MIRPSRRLNWALLGFVLALLAIGLPTVYSAGVSGDDTTLAVSLLQRQVVWLLFGLLALFVTVVVDYRLLAELGPWLLGLAIVLLVLVLQFGSEINGAKAWFRWGPVALQPSELAKLATLLMLANLLAKRPPGPLGWGGTLASLAVLAVPIALIMKQPDLGTTLSFLAMWFAMVVWAGLPARRALLFIGLGVLAVVLAWHLGVLADYQKNRIAVIFNTGVDPRGIGYNLNQSLIAVGSGGLWGHGWLQGTQTHLRFLPEGQTDFIFAVLCEERGLVGAAVVLLLYLGVLWNIWGALPRAGSEVGRLIVVGCGALLLFHVLLNIGMVLGLLPVAGLPLPFLSYGGSNLVTACCLIGLVLNVGRRP